MPALTPRYHSGVVDELRGRRARKIEFDPNYVPHCTEEYHLVLNGVSSKLIPIGNNEYRTEDERYWRIQQQITNTNRGGDY